LLQLADRLEQATDSQRERFTQAPRFWEAWLRELFPQLFSASFGDHQREFWEWIEALTITSACPPFIAIWPRGGAKTTSAEAAVVRLGAKGARRFCLYVRSVQERANESVRNIAAMLEAPTLAHYYPLLTQRRMSKYGFSQGWKADMLRCASGFSVVGLGFDAAVRGVKIEGDRPDLIILDDIDDKEDSPGAVEKKIRTLTTKILPAGAPNAVVLGIQNLMHQGSIFSRLVTNEADFLYDRQLSGPYPAILNLTYTARPGGGYTITGGTPTWAGQDLAVCEFQLNQWGLTAFLQEAQQEVEINGGIWQAIEFQHCERAAVPDLVRGGVWVDPAVTSTDDSDCQAIQADGVDAAGHLYRLYSWEAIASPEEALTRATLKCLELGLDSVGVETDQGGDTWRSVYAQVWARILEAAQHFTMIEQEPDNQISQAWLSAHPELAIVAPLAARLTTQQLTQPSFKSAKAGEGHGSKLARNQRMLVAYEQGRVIHVLGTHAVLERSLKRFPNRPLDLADAAYWGWYDLLDSQRYSGKVGRLADRKTPLAVASTLYSVLRYKGDRNFPLTLGKQVYMVGPGWQRSIERELAMHIATQFPQHFEVIE